MKELKDILKGVDHLQMIGTGEVVVRAITFDSRAVEEDGMFVAYKGVQVDGHNYIDSAIGKGARVVICECMPASKQDDVTYVEVENAQKALAKIASNFYGNPSGELKLVGVTGTNGKTTIATLLYDLFTALGYNCGLLSTVKVCIGEEEIPATHTTPDALRINAYMREMVDLGCDFCFMEVSSHGIAQYRAEGLDFEGGVFTNLSHDHLDYHNTFKEYRDVKKSFFDHLPKSAFALVNTDDKNGPVMLQNTKARKLSYAQKNMADYKVKILERRLDGMLMQLDGMELWCQLIGDFNASNLTAVYAVACELGMDKMEVAMAISQLKSVAGRFQYFKSEEGILVVVDYAHTPDALKNVLETLAGIRTKNEQLITVVGCGGDRDKTKRPEMANIACKGSDKVILTSDNPRTEDPEKILEDMEAGVAPEDFKKTITILDRRQGIKSACVMAEKGDIILIAGKGHENYQEINGVRHHFDDTETAKELLIKLAK